MTGWDVLSEFPQLFTGRGLTEGMARRLIREGVGSPRALLVIGAGSGAAIQPFKDLSCRIVALDRSRRMAVLCRATGISCVVAEATAIPVHRNAFDSVVIVTGVLDCLDDNQSEAVLRECHRITQPDSTLLATHLDHTCDEEFYSQWRLTDGDRVFSRRKIALWNEFESRPEAFADATRVAAMSNFFSALRAEARKKGLPLSVALESLPEFQVIRSPVQLSKLLKDTGWEIVGSWTYSASNAFYVQASRVQSPNDNRESQK